MSKARSGTSYAYQGIYDRDKFAQAFESSFAHIEKFNKASVQDLFSVLSMIEADKRIIDLRWTAYMLATMFIETSHTIRIGGGHGHQKKVWRNFTPTVEVGHGRGHAYYFPAKVKRLHGGDARVTEWAGGQWTVDAHSGKLTPVSRGMGAAHNPSAVTGAAYTKDDGVPIQYFGRGYVQLTWWDNYAKAGVTISRGLVLLFNPDLLLDPRIAYQVMATGMVTGRGFANRRKFSQYFTDGKSDYVGARNMVNPRAKRANKQEVAGFAQRFESVLLASRSSPP